MKLMALDGNSLAYRAFYALPEDMTNASGQATNSVYGFTTMLLTLLREHTPDGIIVVFDRSEPTFRHVAIPEYKAQREKAPDTLYQQLGMIRELLDAMGVMWRDMAGFEGDDLIATMAERAEQDGDDLIVVTGDRDSYQLVRDPHIRVLYNKRGVSDYALYDEAGIFERTGVTPAQYADYAALRGDPSDNLDGIPGVGEKTAAKLINQYGNIDAVIAAAEQQTPKLKAGLLEHGERVRRNAEMMILRRDVPLDIDKSALVPHPDFVATDRMFEFLEFKTMGKRLREVAKKLQWDVDSSVDASPQGATTLASVATVQQASITVFENGKDAAATLSSLATWTMAATFVGDTGRSNIDSLAVVIDESAATVGVMSRSVVMSPEVRAAFQIARPVVVHDAKPLMRSLLADGVDVTSLELDTAIAMYLINPSRSSYTLAAVCADMLGQEPQASNESSGQFDFGGNENSDQLVADQALFVAALAPVFGSSAISDISIAQNLCIRLQAANST